MSRLTTSARRVMAIARRDALIELSYRYRLLLSFTTTLATAFLAYFVSQLVDSTTLGGFDGSYFEYVVIGIALTSFADLALSAFSTRVITEQQNGTFEVLLAGSSGVGTLLAGGLVVPLVLTIVDVVLLVGLGVGVVGVGLDAGGVLLALPVLVLTTLTFCALGVVTASLVVLVKRGDPLSTPLSQATLVLSGALFPIELFPGWLQVVCRATPGYHGVRGLREAVLGDGGLAGITDELLVLAGFAAVLLPIAVTTFDRAVREAKRLGVLASY